MPDWNYGADPFNDQLDTVRFLIGDTDSTDQLLYDTEIFYLLSVFPTAKYAAAAAAKACAAKLARKVDKEVGPLKLRASQKYEHYRALAKSLQSEAGKEGMVPYAGGISVADKQAQEQNLDRVIPSFTVRLFEMPEDTQFSTTPSNVPGAPSP